MWLELNFSTVVLCFSGFMLRPWGGALLPTTAFGLNQVASDALVGKRSTIGNSALSFEMVVL
jgi:hypothetical protein